MNKREYLKIVDGYKKVCRYNVKKVKAKILDVEVVNKLRVEVFSRDKIEEFRDVLFSVEIEANFRRKTKNVVKVTGFASGRERVNFGLQM